MGDRELPADHDDPDDVADDGPEARVRFAYDRPAEGPDDEAGDTECRDAEGDRDDQDARDHSRYGVAECEPPTREYEPDDVPNRAHTPILGADDLLRIVPEG